MISWEKIKEFATKEQTTEDNVVREYLQNLFLSYFYQEDGSEKVLFKGGTALRILYQSPRYSEDLDFTGEVAVRKIENMVKKAIKNLRQEGVNLTLKESKSTSGGYLGIMEGTMSERKMRIQLEVSLRLRKKAGKTAILVTTPFLPSYTLFSLHEEELVSEKIDALLERKKTRDFFDLYFILREGLARKTITSQKKKLLKEIENIDNKKMRKGLKPFLPRSYWPLLGSFKENLMRELKRR